ncbi:hypothetical protein [Mycoplasma sp. Mirounga ES2805-ORL]|uniref:hypothetical protein n=1 Tax=Mycoplasma sp. Mirounga ES2805-ORL TaxID=754514 RepID=UPI00197BBF04|nr:hypothetical protein [Mycoplasma sp. Mirounga ES2805-ORL]QSF13563.1 hypothetical protein JXZ90_02735 [Mycoplasma sp. Mirounga ES2805-ORL]
MIDYRKAKNYSLTYIVLSFVSIPVFLIMIFMTLTPYIYKYYQQNPGIDSVSFGFIMFFISSMGLGISVAKLIFFILTIVEGFKLKNNTGAIVCLAGLAVPFASIVGAFMLFFEFKKHLDIQLEEETKKQVNNE